VHRRKRYGSSSRELPGRQFVVFIQNHDQIANASQGDRLGTLVTLDQQKLAAIFTLCSPYVPLLFMGQEYGETSPFLYFTSFDDPGLAEAVREGRGKELSAFAEGHDFADPQDPTTFDKCRLDWSQLTQTPHSGILRLYQDLIALRKRWPCLGNCRKDLTRTSFSEHSKWMMIERADSSPPRALLVCNFGNARQAIPVAFGETDWFLEIWTAAEIYGGPAGQDGPPTVIQKQTSDVILNGGQAALYMSCA
jgi:maltooligosyltrehalose trehalohydrolase